MYADRDFIRLDQPVGDFLPEFRSRTDLDLTFRAAHVHVTGIEFPWALAFSRHFYFHTWHEALIAHCPREWAPGKCFRYGCVGMSLSVRALELLAARNYWDAMERQMLRPMGIRDMLPGGTGFSAEDLARLAVLVANGGRYGALEMFSEATCRSLMPVPLRDHFPDLQENRSRGIGFVRMAPGFYGHGGGCGTCLMADPVKHIVFALTRMEPDDELRAFKRDAFRLLQEFRRDSPVWR
jgi:CubicO group peptidase (beta-lactamase class C family)